MKRSEVERARELAASLFARAGIVMTADELAGIEIADFGLGELDKTGLEIVTYINTERCCAKELALFPLQTCPEHRHAPIPDAGYPGKEETFRCRFGTVHLFVEGEPTAPPQMPPPEGAREHYTAARELVLKPGEQYTIYPDTLHWFRAGERGAVISEFSTRSFDEYDVFTDPRIKRIPETED